MHHEYQTFSHFTGTHNRTLELGPIAVLIAVRGVENAFLKEETVSVQVAELEKKHSRRSRIRIRHVYENKQVQASRAFECFSMISSAINQDPHLLTKHNGQRLRATENCYGPRGSTASHSAIGRITTLGMWRLHEGTRVNCQKKCDDLNDCTAITLSELDVKGFGQCYRKTNIVLSVM